MIIPNHVRENGVLGGGITSPFVCVLCVKKKNCHGLSLFVC